MIPKTIHYCWFGGKEIPDEYKRYIESWEKHCPEYNIIRWDENNFDIFHNKYCGEAYQAKKWAFVSDYARLKIIYENGGIYLDTDVEVLRNLSPLIQNDIGFIGFQNDFEVNTGLGFGAIPQNNSVRAMLDIYDELSFSEFSDHMVPCPALNTVGLNQMGLKTGKKAARTIQHLEGINVYPTDYFNPVNFDSGKIRITNNTFTVHHYSSTWNNEKTMTIRKVKKMIPEFLLNHRTNLIARKDIEQVEKYLQRK